MISSSRQMFAALRGLAFGLILVGSATDPAFAQSNAKAPDAARTLSGDYLSSRHAQVERDLERAIDYQLGLLKRDPNDPEILSGTFNLLMLEGRIREARPLALKILEKTADDPLASAAVLLDEIKGRKFEDALKRLNALPDKSINVFSVPLLKAWVLAGLKRTDAAMEALKPLGDRPGFKSLVLMHSAAINVSAGRSDAAINDYEEALKAREDVPFSVASALGELYEIKGERDKAKALYDKFNEQHPRSILFEEPLKRVERRSKPTPRAVTAVTGAAEALFDLSSALTQRTSRDFAISFAQMALYLDPNLTLAKVLLGDILESENRLEKANVLYGTIDPKSPFAWSSQLRVAANLDKLDKVGEAENRLRALAKSYPKRPDPLIQLGDIFRGHEKFTDAVKAYDDAVARLGDIETHHWGIFYSRGIALERSKNWPRAEADFLKALELEPKQPYVLNYLGYSWVDQGLNLDRAQEMIRLAVTLRPNDGYIVDSMGWAYYRLNKFEEAVVELERAVELRPEDPVINDHLGDAYWQVGRRLEARFQWLRARSLNPEADVLTEIERKLKQGLTADATAIVGRDG